MPTAVEFQRDPSPITSCYVVLVNEHLGNLQPNPAPGTRQVLNHANFQLHFTLGTVAQTRTLVVVDVYRGAQAGSLPFYFLPWQQNAATELTIPAGGGGPDIFMTSMLSGCAVQVHGTAANPTITHANSRQSYDAAYNGQARALQGGVGMTPEDIHNTAEDIANRQCTAAIDAMLPAVPGGALVGTVRKADYAGRVDDFHINAAKARYYATLGYGERFTKYQPATSGQFKPRTGAFVYGKRDVHNDWSFYYQAAVELSVEVAPYFGYASSTQHLNESAVLGQPTRFFPMISQEEGGNGSRLYKTQKDVVFFARRSFWSGKELL
jgi:hypothetical protein